ncbi:MULTISPECIES: transglycosylase domain-containing protein [unclassified Niallia]|uniref:transglycosylase domain-containing protein n=1 Tax=unclassified Niallia TaxID=2837522 RepID=UPI001EDB3115|nr:MULTISPECIES: transglycosylase domain-containing protein [unclassified Niallia]MDL0435252.1 transglycosylase domain-containing protein [Niallia sp. SS-2023]UPO86987.1 penicillin-binding protein [Niallia sp. Man26]
MRKKLGVSFIVIMLIALVAVLYFTAAEKKKYVSFHQFLDDNIPVSSMTLAQSSYILDNSGRSISEISPQAGIRKNLINEEIPQYVKDLFILSEDQHFYEHAGFDLPAIGRALLTNAESDTIEQGGSTITQQLARNMFQSYDKTYNRKLKELLYAYELERKWSKAEILTQYINAVYFANNMYGIEAAANYYFSSKLSDLSKAELSFLASIPNNPTIYDPLKHFEQTKKRQERLISLMEKEGKISSSEAKKMTNEKITLHVQKKTDFYPDYVSYVEDELRALVSEEKGYAKKITKANDKEKEILSKELDAEVQKLLESGVIIHTGMDRSLQEKAVKAVKSSLITTDVEAAAVVIDHKSHTIGALVGGKNYKKYEFNRSYQAYRQPGSAIKPLLVYGPYLQETGKGVKSTVNADAFCKDGYCPQNYSGQDYGNVTLDQAFIHSYNTPAVRLADSIGLKTAFSYLAHFPFKKVTEEDVHLSSAIGGFTVGMSPLEMTNAYTVFGNNGSFKSSHAITSVTDADGNLLYEWKEAEETVWNKATNDKMRTLLKHTVTSGTAKKANFQAPYLGGKTGTTNDYKDYWMVGLSNDLTVGVWVGKDAPTNLKSIESNAPHLSIWKKILIP